MKKVFFAALMSFFMGSVQAMERLFNMSLLSVNMKYMNAEDLRNTLLLCWQSNDSLKELMQLPCTREFIWDHFNPKPIDFMSCIKKIKESIEYRKDKKRHPVTFGFLQPFYVIDQRTNKKIARKFIGLELETENAIAECIKSVSEQAPVPLKLILFLGGKYKDNGSGFSKDMISNLNLIVKYVENHDPKNILVDHLNTIEDLCLVYQEEHWNLSLIGRNAPLNVKKLEIRRNSNRAHKATTTFEIKNIFDLKNLRELNVDRMPPYLAKGLHKLLLEKFTCKGLEQKYFKEDIEKETIKLPPTLKILDISSEIFDLLCADEHDRLRSLTILYPKKDTIDSIPTRFSKLEVVILEGYGYYEENWHQLLPHCRRLSIESWQINLCEQLETSLCDMVNKGSMIKTENIVHQNNDTRRELNNILKKYRAKQK